MKRRSLVVSALAAGLSSTSPATLAQKTTPPRIGYLAPSHNPYEEVFWQELRRLGYIDRKTIVVEYRSADGDFTRLPALAKQLVNLNVNVIVAQVTQAAIAVASGLVASLGRPGGNVTGTSAVAAGVVGKQPELLRDLLPGIAQVAARRRCSCWGIHYSSLLPNGSPT